MTAGCPDGARRRCGSWTAERRAQPYNAELAWVLGYISRATESGRLRKTDPDGIAGWIDNYCTQHPLERVSDAAYQLTVELSKK